MEMRFRKHHNFNNPGAGYGCVFLEVTCPPWTDAENGGALLCTYHLPNTAEWDQMSEEIREDMVSYLTRALWGAYRNRARTVRLLSGRESPWGDERPAAQPAPAVFRGRNLGQFQYVGLDEAGIRIVDDVPNAPPVFGWDELNAPPVIPRPRRER